LQVSIRKRAKEVLQVGRIATAGLRLRPAFLVIGGQRCGTTSLYDHLARHPDVLRAFRKEVHFFDVNWSRGEWWYLSHFPTRARARVLSRRRGRPVVTGEASPYYLFHPAAARRAARTVPEARLVALLRNPVDRALSHYHHEVRLGHEALTFEEAIAAEENRLAGEREALLADDRARSFAHRSWSYLARGRYAEQLEEWWRWFPRERLLVLRSEDLFADPPGTVGRVLEFLGLPPLALGGFGNVNEQRYSRMDPALRARLARYFEPHNQRLQELLGRDLEWE
jgi:hypothetical protein